MLQALRVASRDSVASRFAEVLKQRYPRAPDARVRLAMKMMVELIYSAAEMAVEEPDQDARALSREVCLLVERDRVVLSADILEIFIEKVAEDKGVFQGQVTTASELDGERRNKLTDALQTFTGKLLQIDFRVDPEIIGGVVFKQKDTLVDSSVAGRFAEIKRRLEGVRVV